MMPCLELLHVTITINFKHTLNIVVVYRPPSTPYNDFLENFLNFLSNILTIQKTIFYCVAILTLIYWIANQQQQTN